DAEALANEQQQVAAKMRKLARPPANSASGSGSNYKWVWIILVVAGFLARAVSNPSSNAPSNKQFLPPPSIQQAPLPKLDEFLKNKKFRFVEKDGKMKIEAVPDDEKAAAPPEKIKDSP